MTLVLRWRAPDPPIVTRWRGPAAMASALARSPAGPIAAIIGPPGPAGPVGDPGATLQFDVAAPAATWIIPHGLDHKPMVQVFLASGEAVIVDVATDNTYITVTFPTPQQGFVLAS